MDHIRDSYIKVWQGVGICKDLAQLIRLPGARGATLPVYLLTERASEDADWGECRKLPLGEAGEWIADNGGTIIFGGIGS